MPFLSGDYYRRLRVSKLASNPEIRAAFRRLARQYHPDLHPNQPGAAVRFQSLKEAYEVLSDRVRRHQYDQIHGQINGHINDQISDQTHDQSNSQSSAISQQNLAQRVGKKRPDKPKTPYDFYLRGVSYVLSQRYHAALEDFAQAIKINEQFAEAYLQRAQVYYQIEDDPGVLRDCQQALALNFCEPQVYFYQGLARYRMDYVQSAIAAFTDAIRHDAQDARYYYHRGLAHEDLHDLKAAANDLRQAARLYRKQGDLTHYYRLQQYLQKFGAIGRSRPIQFLDGIVRRFSVRPQIGPSRRGSDSSFRQPQNQNRNHRAEANREAYPLKGLSATPMQSRIAARLAGRSLSASWAEGVSSWPQRHSRRLSGRRWLMGLGNLIKLLSNPAGEMLPLYWQISSRQTVLAGYGLAVIANVCFVLGGLFAANRYDWLLASQLWAAGALVFVAMIVALAIARFWLRDRSLWVADILMLGAAVWPLGLLTGVIALLRHSSDGLNAFGLYGLTALAMLWAFSHSLLTLYSGLSRIHAFSERVTAWLAPLILTLGIVSGVGTWGFFKLSSQII